MRNGNQSLSSFGCKTLSVPPIQTMAKCKIHCRRRVERESTALGNIMWLRLKFLRRSLQRIICPSAACSLPPWSARCKWHFYVFCITMYADSGRRASWTWTTTTDMRLMQRWYAFNSNKRGHQLNQGRRAGGCMLHIFALRHIKRSESPCRTRSLRNISYTPPRLHPDKLHAYTFGCCAMIFALCYW